MNPFSRGRSSGDADASAGDGFDDLLEFVADNLPDPGPLLADHDVLEGDDHVVAHELAHELFDERGVYDATFGYNLARLNLDRRHPEAGFRYAVDAEDATVLRAEFTPTTEFCPQADALVTGSFRAWNGLRERHAYALVRVRVHPSHHQGEILNNSLRDLEDEFRDTGTVPGDGAATGTDADESDGIDSDDRDEDVDSTSSSPF